MDATHYSEFTEAITGAIWRELPALADETEDSERLPYDRLFPTLREMRAFALTTPEAYGGVGLTMTQYAPIIGQFAKVHGGIRALVHVHNSFAHALCQLGSERQRSDLLPGCADGSRSIAFALTEPDHGTGSDVGTSACLESGDYVIDGRKWLITNSDFASHFIVICKVEDRPSAILVERDRPGLTIEPLPELMGCKGGAHGLLTFKQVRVPRSNLIGQEGNGLAAMEQALEISRVLVAASSLGTAERALELSLDHAKSRVTFGHAHHPAAGDRPRGPQRCAPAGPVRASQGRAGLMAMLDRRVAIVTGAGRGIGRSVALLLAREGASVVVNDLGSLLDGSGTDNGPAREVVREITRTGGRAIASGADVSDHIAAESLVKSAISEFGRLDVLVNVAGILRDRMIFNLTEQEWDDVIRVHLKGTFNTTKFAAAYWRSLRNETASNRLINFTSVSGLHGAPGQPNYAAAKMGIVGLTYSCASSLARYGVTANAISPGADTRMTDSVPSDRRWSTPGSDERSPDNIAPVVAYLASEQSGWMNGQVVHSSGYEVSVYNKPRPTARLVGTGPWSLEALATQMERSFRPERVSSQEEDYGS